MVASWRPDVAVQFAPTTDPNDPAVLPVWVDLSAKVTDMSSCKRGRQYELDQNQANAPKFTFIDPNEDLNPDNPSSPYAGYLLPYREILWQAMWPNTTTGNLLNTGSSILYDGDPPDPSFESYAAGEYTFCESVGGTAPVVSTTTPYQGSKDLRWTHLGTSTVQGTSWFVSCIPGRTYTSSAYVRQSTASTLRIQVQPWVWRGGARVVGTTTNGTSTATTGSYVRLTVTFTATQPQYQVAVVTVGTATAGTVLLDAVQHEQAGSATAFTTSGPVIYTAFRGFVERFPRSWRHRGSLGLCQATAVDAFGPLNRFKVDTEVVGSYVRSKPLLWWSLAGDDTATLWGEQSGNGGSSLHRITAPWGAGLDLMPGVGNMLPGDPGGIGVEIPIKSTSASGSTVLGNALPLSVTASGSTFELSLAIWYTNADSDPSSTSTWGAPIMLYNPTTGAYFRIFIDITNADVGAATGMESAGAFAWDFAYDDAAVYEPGETRFLVGTFVVGAGTTTISLYENGALTATSATSTASTYGSASPDATTTSMWVGGRMWMPVGSGGLTGDCMPGIYAHAGVWDRALTADEIADMYASGRGGAGETAGDRISRYLSYGWSGDSYINPGKSIMGVNSLSKKTALLGACQAVSTSADGNLFAAMDGAVTFRGRDERYMTMTSIVTFGEDVAGGEYPYTENLLYDRDPMRIYNDVTVTNSGGVIARRADDASIKSFFPNTYERTVNVADDNEAIACAQWLLTNHKDPQSRIASITLDPASYPALWPVVLGLEIGNRVTVIRRPKAANGGAGLTMSADYFIESISHDNVSMQAGTWPVTLMLSPVPALKPFILDDPVYGVLDDTSCTTVY
jgi:hypothetical protein